MSLIPIIPCTTCNYCAKVCPKNIGISGSFTALNYLILYKNPEAAARYFLSGGCLVPIILIRNTTKTILSVLYIPKTLFF